MDMLLGKQRDKQKVIFEMTESFQTGSYIFSLKNILFQLKSQNR